MDKRLRMHIDSKNRKIAIVLTSCVLVLSVGVLIASLIVANNLQNKVAERQLKMNLEQIELETETEFSNLYMALNVVKDWANSSSLQNIDAEELNKKIIPIIANTPQVSALSIVTSTGQTYSIRYESPNYESYFTENDTLNKAQVKLMHPEREAVMIADTSVPYKVTELASYTKHQTYNSDTIVRYPLQYIPGMTKLAGTAFTVRTSDDDGNTYVITVYKTLYRLYSFLNTVKVSETSEVHLFTPEGEYFDLSRLNLNKNVSSIDGYLVPWNEISDTGFFKAVSKWKAEKQHDSLSYVEYSYKGVDYLAVFKPNRDAVSGIWTALVMSEADFGIVLKGKLGVFLVSSISFLLISLVIILFLIRRSGSARMIYKLDDMELGELIKGGENDLVEFKSTVRLNLHSNKMGKEIELAWLKSVVAFCNTEGGRILIGVKDDGEILGLEADRFPNDDKTLLHIQNLIKQHIGLEFAKYIHYTLRAIEGKKILVIRCQPISVPMFLRFNDKEQFFVRSGPASIELPVSKALQYIKERSS